MLVMPQYMVELAFHDSHDREMAILSYELTDYLVKRI